MNPQHVAQVVRPATGGIRTHVLTLLNRCGGARVTSTLFAPGDFELNANTLQAPRENIDIAAGTSPARDLLSILRLSRRLRGRFDVVHAHGLRGALIGVTAARLARIPAVFTAHNLAPRGSRAARLLLGFLGRCSTPVAVSEAVAASLRACGVPASAICVIPNGVDVAPLAASRMAEAARRSLLAALIEGSAWSSAGERIPWLREPRNAEAEIVVVGAIGRLAREKGFDVLVSAFDQWQTANRNEQQQAVKLLVLAGSGAELAALQSAAGDVPNVVLAGRVDNVSDVLRISDIVAVPSREEGQGIVALEAMAAARPVIATAVGGLPESVVDGETGLLVPPEDAAALARALERLAASPGERTRMGESGRRRVANLFTTEVMVERIVNLYLSVATQSPAKPSS